MGNKTGTGVVKLTASTFLSDTVQHIVMYDAH